MFRKNLLISAIILGFSGGSFAASTLSDSQITKMNLSELRSALDKKDITSEQIVSAYMAAINKDDRQGKKIKALITLNPDALSQAKAWDEADHGGKANAPLAGIPFIAKDNFDTKDILTTGGNLALETNKPAKNAFVIEKLLNEGAILIGKANMSELAASYGWMGYSSVGGQTVNPYNPLRDTSGSSSGSAAAVAAGFAPFALGTDTSGSIRGPASVTGTVGLRPTLGLTSRSGVIPLSLTADNVGAITRTVSDQAIVLDAIRGMDPNDRATEFVKQPVDNFSHSVASGSLKGKKFAVLDNFDGGNPDVDRIKNEAVNQLIHDGASVTHIHLPAEFENLWSLVLGPVGTAEFRPQFDAYLATLGNDQPKNSTEFLSVLNKLTDNGKKTINPGRYKGLIESIGTTTTDSPEYIGILTQRIPHLLSELLKIVQEGGYDAIIFPTMSCPASVIHGKSDKNYICKSVDSYAASYIASSTGFPEITVPAGKAVGNVPVGFSFMGKAGDDLKIMQFAYQFEKK
ncbi:TPA: amidase [Klebsiella variicola]|nr:amidase [Klebsiella variicola]